MRVALLFAGAALAAALSACSTTGGGPSSSTAGATTTIAAPQAGPERKGLAGIFAPDPNRNLVTVQSDGTQVPAIFLQQGYCPPVEIRAGTEALVVYEKGHEDDPNYIRFQGSITKTARECRVVATDQLAIKVGIAGRIVAGPKGNAGAVTATLRVAVVKQHGGEVLYTQGYKVAANIAAPEYGSDYTQVIDNIVLTLGPTDRDLIVYVGYDEGKPKPTS